MISLLMKHSNISLKLIVVFIFFIILAGCARRAPDLPPAYASHNDEEIAIALGITDKDKSMSCFRIKIDQQKAAKEYEQNEAIIESSRTHNQVTGYIGVFFPPALIAADNDDEIKAQLDTLQNRKDQLDYLWKSKSCR
jgi:hypothetical protein